MIGQILCRCINEYIFSFSITRKIIEIEKRKNLNEYELKINASCVEYSLYFIDEKGDKIGI